MVLCSHRAIFGRVEHRILPRKFTRPDLRQDDGRGTLKGVPSAEVSKVKPERLASCVSIALSLRLRCYRVETIAGAVALGRAWQFSVRDGLAGLRFTRRRLRRRKEVAVASISSLGSKCARDRPAQRFPLGDLLFKQLRSTWS